MGRGTRRRAGTTATARRNRRSGRRHHRRPRSPETTSIRKSGDDGSTANRAVAGLSTRFRPASREASWMVNPPILRCTRLGTERAARSRAPAAASGPRSGATGSLASAEHGFFRPQHDLTHFRFGVRSGWLALCCVMHVCPLGSWRRRLFRTSTADVISAFRGSPELGAGVAGRLGRTSCRFAVRAGVYPLDSRAAAAPTRSSS